MERLLLLKVKRLLNLNKKLDVLFFNPLTHLCEAKRPLLQDLLEKFPRRRNKNLYVISDIAKILTDQSKRGFCYITNSK